MPRPLIYNSFVGGACSAAEREALQALAAKDNQTLAAHHPPAHRGGSEAGAGAKGWERCGSLTDGRLCRVWIEVM